MTTVIITCTHKARVPHAALLESSRQQWACTCSEALVGIVTDVYMFYKKRHS